MLCCVEMEARARFGVRALATLCASSMAVHYTKGALLCVLHLKATTPWAGLAYVVATFAGGAWAQHHGRRETPLAVLMTAATLCGVVAACVAASGFVSLLWQACVVAGAASGIYQALLLPSTRMLAADQKAADRWAGIVALCPLGALAGYAVTRHGVLLHGVTWSVMCAASLAPLLLTAWALLRVPGPVVMATRSSTMLRSWSASGAVLLRDRQIWLLTVASAAYYYGVGVLLRRGVLSLALCADASTPCDAPSTASHVLGYAALFAAACLSPGVAAAGERSARLRGRAAMLLVLGTTAAVALIAARYAPLHACPASVARSCIAIAVAALAVCARLLHRLAAEEYGGAVGPYAWSACCLATAFDLPLFSLTGGGGDGDMLLSLAVYAAALCAYCRIAREPMERLLTPLRLDETQPTEQQQRAAEAA